MGWSLDLLMDDIDAIFKGVEHEVVMPEATRPYVYFNYEGEINKVKKGKLVALFPPDVYVFFYPNTVKKELPPPKDVKFPEGKPELKSFKITFPEGSI